MSIHNGKIFSQIEGEAIGNSLGPTLANWFFEMIAKEIFNQNLSFHPPFYVCYVDDVLAIFNSSADAQLLLNVLHNQHPNLRFT